MAKVQNLFRAPKKRLPMEELSEVRAVGNIGFEGCAHGRPGGPRQVLLVDRETLEAMDLQPGIIRENITTDSLNVNGLRIGQLLRVGEATGSQRGMYAVRSDGGHPARPSQRAMGTAGYALSRSGRRSDPPRRFYRKTFLTTLS